MEDMHSLALSSLGFILTQLIQRLRYSYIGIYGFELLKTRRRTFPNKYKILNIEGKMYCHKEVKDIVYPRFLKSLTKTQPEPPTFLFAIISIIFPSSPCHMINSGRYQKIIWPHHSLHRQYFHMINMVFPYNTHQFNNRNSVLFFFKQFYKLKFCTYFTRSQFWMATWNIYFYIANKMWLDFLLPHP